MQLDIKVGDRIRFFEDADQKGQPWTTKMCEFIGKPVTIKLIGKNKRTFNIEQDGGIYHYANNSECFKVYTGGPACLDDADINIFQGF